MIVCVCVNMVNNEEGARLEFYIGCHVTCCITSLPRHYNKSHCFEDWLLRAFVKLKIIKIIENYRSRIGKVHGSEITFNVIMCLLAIIFYYLVLPKAQFSMVLLKGFKSSW